MKPIGCAAWLVVYAVVLGGVAHADDASEAKLQFDLGQELYKQKRFPEAVDHLIASNRLVPNANVVFNVASIYRLMAMTEEKKHDNDKAAEHFIESYNWTETYLTFALSEAEKSDGIKLRDSLKPRVAIVDVVSKPGGAEIVIDREALGTVGLAPRCVAVSPGPHTVILKAPGYHDARMATAAGKGEKVSVNLVLERITGTLHVESIPPGARVSVEATGEELGTTPFERSLPVGNIRIVIALEGYLDLEREVVIDEGKPAVVPLTLQRSAQSVATLSVTGTPSRAIVRLDGRSVGEVPTSVAGLLPGKGHLEILALSHQSWSSEIPLEGGAATRVAVRLAPEEKPAWRGWKWIGYIGGSAVLATGAIVGFAAREAKSSYDADPSRSEFDRTGSLNTTADVLMSTGAVAILTTAAMRWLWPAPLLSHADVSVVR